MRSKKNIRQQSSKEIQKNAETVIVFRTRVPVEETLFPEKVKMANELLSNAILLPRK